MEKQTGTINVQTENIFPIIKKFLYSDHEIFLRELVSNSVDACQKVKTLAALGEIKSDASNLMIEVSVDKEAKTIVVKDNGIGMTNEEVDRYINQIAFSGAEEFVSKYKDAQIIGHFGLGFYSAFMVAAKVEIHTLSYREGATAVHWECDGSPNFTLTAGSRTAPGTEITLHIADDSIEFLEDDRIEGILTKYCKFMPVQIRYGDKKEWIEDPSGEKEESGEVKRVESSVPNIINNTVPAWTRKPADLKEEDYKEFYHELYPMTFDEPLFNIHVNVDYPFNLTGILYFPRLKNNMEVQKNKVQLYCNQVFITDEVKNILPDFLTLLHGVIDSPDIPLNVSRSYLQEDSNVKKISTHITKKVADKLHSMFSADRADFEKKWDDIGVFIQYGMLTDDKFREKANGFGLYRDTNGKYYTLEELKEAVKDTQKDKKGDTIFLYTHSKNEQHAFVESANDRGYVVIEMDGPLTSHFISHIESKNPGLHFKRVDADILDKLIEKDEIQTSALNEEQSAAVKTVLEEIIADKTYQVSFANMSPTEAPFVIVQNEFMRRMKEQSAMGGGSFYGTLPDSYNVVANANHPLLSKLAEGGDAEANKEIARQAIDLALLSKGLLKGSELTRFIKKSFDKLA
jgi:molecular chaperone HtpG